MDSVVLDNNSAVQYLERRLQENDVKGAVDLAISWQNMFPKLKRLLRFLSNIIVQVSTDGEEIDWYSVLGVDPSADTKTMKQHYVKLATNNRLGSREAHKLLNKAWDTLSNIYTRKDYDLRRRSRENRQNASVLKQASSATQLHQPAPVLHEVSGNNRSGVRLVSLAAQEIQPAPDLYNISGDKLPEGQYNISGNGGSGPMLFFSPTQSIQPAPGMHDKSGNKGSIPKLVSSVTQSNHPAPGLCSGLENNGSGFTTVSSDAQLFQSPRVNLKRCHVGGDQTSATRTKSRCIYFKESDISLPPVAGSTGSTHVKHKGRMRLVEHTCDSSKNVPENYMPSESNGQTGVHLLQTENSQAEKVGTYGSGKGNSKKKLPDVQRNILMMKARKVILDKLNECRAAVRDNNEHNPAVDRENAATEGPKEDGFKTMEVPDSDFHDFDNDRTLESFADNQVWAVYDEDDGMPRLYALIRKASERPFKLQLSWLNSKSNMDLESIKWMNSGFHKTCGDFCVGKEKISIELNSFSHRVAGWTKAGKVFQIFPKKGEVWALYRNWSRNWNEHTAEEEKHKYDMVEVLEDFNEEKGVTIVPLVKVCGFKAVFCQHSDAKVRTVPKKEIFRFSHQVSSFLLTDQEAPNVPKGSKELDPAAMPLELLQVIH